MTPNKSNRKNNQGRDTQKSSKRMYGIGLPGKPVFEETRLELSPELELLQETNYGLQTIVAKAHCGQVYRVQQKRTYTLRLGVHSSNKAAGAFDEYTTVACFIPIEYATEQRITCFFVSEEHQACFMDTVWLKAEKPFKIVHVFGSAVLESNSDALAMPLGFEDTSDRDGQMVIFRSGSSEDNPPYSVFRFDLLRIRVEIV